MTDPLSAQDQALQGALTGIDQSKAERERDALEAACPLAERIIRNNPAKPLPHGMQGFFALMNSYSDPSAIKRTAAQRIIYLRRNRIACMSQGRNHRGPDAHILTEIAAMRKRAS